MVQKGQGRRVYKSVWKDKKKGYDDQKKSALVKQHDTLANQAAHSSPSERHRLSSLPFAPILCAKDTLCG